MHLFDWAAKHFAENEENNEYASKDGHSSYSLTYIPHRISQKKKPLKKLYHNCHLFSTFRAPPMSMTKKQIDQ